MECIKCIKNAANALQYAALRQKLYNLLLLVNGFYLCSKDDNNDVCGIRLGHEVVVSDEFCYAGGDDAETADGLG